MFDGYLMVIELPTNYINDIDRDDHDDGYLYTASPAMTSSFEASRKAGPATPPAA